MPVAPPFVRDGEFECFAFVLKKSVYLTDENVFANHDAFRGVEHLEDATRVIHPGLYFALLHTDAARFGHRYAAFARVLVSGEFVSTPDEIYCGELTDVKRFYLISNGTDELGVEVDLDATNKIDPVIDEKLRAKFDPERYNAEVSRISKKLGLY